MVSERELADLKAKLESYEKVSMATGQLLSQQVQEIAERDRRIAELEGVLRSVQDRLQHREDIRDVCYDSCPRCAVDAALAGKGVSRG